MSAELLATAAPTAAEFRPIQYLGNKWRLLDEISAAVDSIAGPGGTAVDLFAGSGVVAQRLGRDRNVLACDVQQYSRVLTTAMLDPHPLTDHATNRLFEMASEQLASSFEDPALADLCKYEEDAVERAGSGDVERLAGILEWGSIVRHAVEGSPASELGTLLHYAAETLPRASSSVITRYYGGLYFSYRQAAELDALAAAARRLGSHATVTALAAVLGAASELVSSVGSQFAQPVRPRDKSGRLKVSSIRHVARRRALEATCRYLTLLQQYASLPRTTRAHSFYCGNFADALTRVPDDVSVVYADPPYTRDHYSRFYHVLETLAVGDEPEISMMNLAGAKKLSRGLYRAERHQSPFCIRTQALDAFERMFTAVATLGVPLVLSYSPYNNGTAARPQPRLATIDDLVERARRHFRAVEVKNVVSTHSKLNREQVNRSVDHHAEVLLVASR